MDNQFNYDQEPMTRDEVLESAGLVAFAAWCGIPPEHAAAKQLWNERHGRGVMEQWDRVTLACLKWSVEKIKSGVTLDFDEGENDDPES